MKFPKKYFCNEKPIHQPEGVSVRKVLTEDAVSEKCTIMPEISRENVRNGRCNIRKNVLSYMWFHAKGASYEMKHDFGIEKREQKGADSMNRAKTISLIFPVLVIAAFIALSCCYGAQNLEMKRFLTSANVGADPSVQVARIWAIIL